MVIYFVNGVVIVIFEKIVGFEKEFVDVMNKKVDEFNLGEY